MGADVAKELRAAGHSVIGVDLNDVEVVADLSTADGRSDAANAVLKLASERIDGAVLAAGVGPTGSIERAQLIIEVNYFGVVDLLTAWRPALAAANGARVVVFSSNSSTTVPIVPASEIRALLAHDSDKALRIAKRYRKMAPVYAYAGSKIAVARWVRRNATKAEWAGTGIRLNAIAPGAIMTPMLEEQLANPRERRQIEAFPIPIGQFGDPSHLADWVIFMLSAAADFLVGTVVFVDGGTDAYFRADEWPRSVPLTGLPRYLVRTRAWKKRSTR
jgi:NAD(P)-dependent dehydrogenase (short-subunit alcohol dehydrogenase family)